MAIEDVGRALLDEAEKATANNDYLRAAECYARAAELFPQSPEYRMMAGHRLKDARDYRGAFDAYSSVLASDPTGDVYVQLGHLFKITGNINEAEWAYRESARMGEATAQGEIANLGSASAGQLAFFGASAKPDDLPPQAFWDVHLCRRGEGLDHGAITNAGKSLALNGLSDVARAFFEVAYLTDDVGAFRQEHFALVQRAGVWPAEHLSELVKANLTRTDRRAMSPRARLQRMIPQILGRKELDERDASEWPPIPTKPRSEWPPSILTGHDSQSILDRLTEAVDQVYRAVAVRTPISGAAVIGSVQALQQAAIPSDHVITFPNAADFQNLRLVAAGVLNDLVRRWLRHHAKRFIGAYVTPEQIAADLSFGGLPLADLVADLQSAAAVFDEINRQLPPSTAGRSSPALDGLFTQLAATGAPALTVSQIDDLLQEAIERRLPQSIMVLAWSLVAADAPAWMMVRCAQRLKSAGYLAIAYKLMKRGDEETDAPRDYLVEKALLAKIMGDFTTAARLFENVAAGDPVDVFARQELVAILPEVEPIASIIDRFRSDSLFLTLAREHLYYRKALGEEIVDFNEVFSDEGVTIFDLAPEIASEFAPRGGRTIGEEIELLDIGRQRRRGMAGEVILLHACDFVRARIHSATEIVSMRARIDGKTVGVAAPVMVASDDPLEPIKTWIVNCWMDLSDITLGSHLLQLYVEEREGGYRSREQTVWVDPAPATPNEEESASLFDVPANAAGLSIEERINSLPSVVLQAERNIFQGDFKNVLVVRADQLGDVALSLSAMFALRDLFPRADLTCLAARSNRELLLSTGLFSEVLTVEMVHDALARRRFATIAEQLRLRKTLEPKSFDLAIDLSTGADTRPLLRLAAARYTAGFSPRDFPWLTFGINLQTRDVGNWREGSPHSASPMALVVALAAVMRHAPFRLPSPNADPSLLAGLGLDPNRPFATLHSGARTVTRKWPLANYLKLAALIISEWDLQVALLVDSPDELQVVEPAVLASPDLHLIARPLSFPQFDAVLSCCAVFVGNDTGPKHLASVRGAPVVSIHMGAVNWREWGQEAGFIVTRRTPCYGCGIEQIEECGKGLPCLVNISVDEVFGAVRRALAMKERDRQISASIPGVPPAEYDSPFDSPKAMKV